MDRSRKPDTSNSTVVTLTRPGSRQVLALRGIPMTLARPCSSLTGAVLSRTGGGGRRSRPRQCRLHQVARSTATGDPGPLHVASFDDRGTTTWGAHGTDDEYPGGVGALCCGGAARGLVGDVGADLVGAALGELCQRGSTSSGRSSGSCPSDCPSNALNLIAWSRIRGPRTRS